MLKKKENEMNLLSMGIYPISTIRLDEIWSKKYPFIWLKIRIHE